MLPLWCANDALRACTSRWRVGERRWITSVSVQIGATECCTCHPSRACRHATPQPSPCQPSPCSPVLCWHMCANCTMNGRISHGVGAASSKNRHIAGLLVDYQPYKHTTSLCRGSPVDHQLSASDIGRLVRRQVEHAVGDIIGNA